jgi:hypothetical protein
MPGTSAAITSSGSTYAFKLVLPHSLRSAEALRRVKIFMA